MHDSRNVNRPRGWERRLLRDAREDGSAREGKGAVV
jgi:hypothetical protein